MMMWMSDDEFFHGVSGLGVVLHFQVEVAQLLPSLHIVHVSLEIDAELVDRVGQFVFRPQDGDLPFADEGIGRIFLQDGVVEVLSLPRLADRLEMHAFQSLHAMTLGKLSVEIANAVCRKKNTVNTMGTFDNVAGKSNLSSQVTRFLISKRKHRCKSLIQRSSKSIMNGIFLGPTRQTLEDSRLSAVDGGDANLFEDDPDFVS